MPINANADLSITVTGVWTADTSSDNTPPPSIVFGVSSNANAYSNTNGGPTQPGTANDGYGDPVGQASPSLGTSATPGVKYLPGSSSFTVSLTLSAFASGAPGIAGGGGAAAYVGPVTISVHAQPYNFRRTYFANVTPQTSVINTAGRLQFQYKWSSTDGVMQDLSGETIHENVDAPSSPSFTINGITGYAPPPPFGWSPSFHFDGVPVDASYDPGISDTHSWGNGKATLSQCFATPYQANSFALTQTYKFNDPATMAVGVEQTIPGDAGPITITDAVVADSTSPSGYSFIVTKSGTPSLPQNLP